MNRKQLPDCSDVGRKIMGVMGGDVAETRASRQAAPVASITNFSGNAIFLGQVDANQFAGVLKELLAQPKA